MPIVLSIRDDGWARVEYRPSLSDWRFGWLSPEDAVSLLLPVASALSVDP